MFQKFVCLLRDYAELTKARITTLIVLTAWCGYFFGAHRLGVSSWSLGLFHALFGMALVSSGTAALNEVLESNVDARMRRTALAPCAFGTHVAGARGYGRTGADSGRFRVSRDLRQLTDWDLSISDRAGVSGGLHSTEKVSPMCTFVGAFPGAMPVVLGWTAVRGNSKSRL